MGSVMTGPADDSTVDACDVIPSEVSLISCPGFDVMTFDSPTGNVEVGIVVFVVIADEAGIVGFVLIAETPGVVVPITVASTVDAVLSAARVVGTMLVDSTLVLTLDTAEIGI